MFLDSMRDTLKANPQGKRQRILFAEADEDRTLQGVRILQDEGLTVPMLVGDTDKVRKKARAQGLDLGDVEILDPMRDKRIDEYAAKYFDLRKHKGMTEDEAAKKIREPHYYGAMLVHEERADGMVSGLNEATKPFKPAFEIIRLRDGYKRASSVFVLEWPERLLFFADCAVNINPDAETLAEIAHATIETVRWLKVEPRVAFLSFSTYGSAKGPEVEKMQKAVAIAREKNPDCVIDGEMQFDAALMPKIATRKAPNSPFAEEGANIFIFPDLNCGNIAYKISERLGKARATGPMLQGLNKPVNDVSRGCSAEDMANAAVLTAALAMRM